MVCHRLWKMGKEHFVCIGISDEAPEGLHPDDVIHLCTFSKEQDKKMVKTGICRPQGKLSMTPEEAIIISQQLVLAVFRKKHVKRFVENGGEGNGR